MVAILAIYIDLIIGLPSRLLGSAFVTMGRGCASSPPSVEFLPTAFKRSPVSFDRTPRTHQALLMGGTPRLLAALGEELEVFQCIFFPGHPSRPWMVGWTRAAVFEVCILIIICDDHRISDFIRQSKYFFVGFGSDPRRVPPCRESLRIEQQMDRAMVKQSEEIRAVIQRGKGDIGAEMTRVRL